MCDRDVRRRSTDSPRRRTEGDERFGVVIRVRPPLERELSSPAWQNVVSVEENQVCLHELIENVGDSSSGAHLANHTFGFDWVFDQGCPQTSVYNTIRSSVQSTLQGYNATILAYGPTGSGKTYTMEGKRAGGGDMRGIIPRSIEDIFQHIKHCKAQARFLVRASFLQIYNEVLCDLLKPERQHLLIREDARRGVFVEGLSEWLCRCPAEVRRLIESGTAARSTSSTRSNDESSRSHAVFIVTVEQSGPDEIPNQGESERAAGPEVQNECFRVGRLNLVDLAGSERPRFTGSTGQRLEETKKINQSLSALGNVISALTERRARQHVPYRDSKLTRILEDSLGGNCRTTMMAMVSPAAEAFSETLCTLKFAHRAKTIRTNPRVNEDVDQRTMLRRYEAELKRLRAELRNASSSVDRTQIMELEAGRRRAEEDRIAAVYALEEHGFILEEEKRQKRQLEEKIEKMSSQLLVGGQQVDTVEYRRALQEQRSDYTVKLAELEKERSMIEEDKAQVSRYKQLLLKQRDIMIALTQRLHERDETIIGLQDEIDVRDRRVSELEDLLADQGLGPMPALGSISSDGTFSGDVLRQSSSQGITMTSSTANSWSSAMFRSGSAVSVPRPGTQALASTRLPTPSSPGGVSRPTFTHWDGCVGSAGTHDQPGSRRHSDPWVDESAPVVSRRTSSVGPSVRVDRGLRNSGAFSGTADGSLGLAAVLAAGQRLSGPPRQPRVFPGR